MKANIIDFTLERQKRTNPSTTLIKIAYLLEEVLEETPLEDYALVLENFILGLDLGETPITTFTEAYKENPEVFSLMSTILDCIPLEIKASLLISIENAYPKDSAAIKRLKFLFSTMMNKDLSLKKVAKTLPDVEHHIVQYLSGTDRRFEEYAFSTTMNVIPFPSPQGQACVIV